PRRSRRAISTSPSRRAGSSSGRPAIRVRMRLRSWRAKCGVEAPISCRTSATDTWYCGRRRSGCSAWAMGSVASGVDGLDLEEGVDARLHVRGDGRLVAHQPAVIVDPAYQVLVVAALDVEQVVLQRLGEGLRLGDEQQRTVGARRGKR